MLRLIRSLTNGVELSRLLRPENYAIFIPILTITSAFANGGVSDPWLLAAWAIANLIAFALLFLLMAGLADLIRKGSRQPLLRLPGLLVFGTLLGTLKNLFTFASFALLHEPGFGSWIIERTLANLPMGITVIGIVALMLVAKDNYLAERELLLSQRLASKETADRSASARIRESLVEQAAREIAKVRRRLGGSSEGGKLMAQAKDLKDLAEFTLRPLSHRIWSEQSVKLNDFSLKQLLRLGLSEKPFVPILFVLVFIPGLLTWAEAQHGIARAAVMIAQIAILLLALQFSTNWLKLNRPLAGWLRLGSVAVIGSLGATLILYPAETFASEPEMFAMFAMLFSLTIWFLALSLMIAILAAGLRVRADLRSELEAIYGKEDLDRILDGSVSIYESRKVAQALHSDVQNRLISAALQLEQGKLATKEQLAAELSAIEAIVLELGKTGSPRQKSAKQEITAAANSWRGFLEVELAVSGDLAPWDPLANELGQAINEALSNAKRHGDARTVKIDLRTHENRLEISVNDDGQGFANPSAGLGFALFQSLSPQGFQIENTAYGAQLKMSVQTATK